MSGEPGSTTPAGDTLHGHAATMHVHVNSLKAKLGLDNENSPLGKLAAHTRRKLKELEAARAAGITAAPGSADWHAAMKPESFSKGFIKANRTQFLITASVFSLGLFWLIVIRTVHHNDNAAQTGNSEVAQKALADKQRSGALATPGGFGTPNSGFGAPNSGFGAPNSGFGAPNSGFSTPNGAYQPPQPMLQNASTPQAPYGQPLQLAPSGGQVVAPFAQQGQGLVQQGQGSAQQAQGFAQQPQGYPQQPQVFSQGYAQQPQVFGAQPSAYAQQMPGYGIQPSPGYAGGGAASFGTPQPAQLYPVRQHSAARHQVVVNR